MSKSGFTIRTAVILVLAFAANSLAEYSGGTGEPNSPFEIGTVGDWQDLMDTPTDWDKHFSLTADLDVSGVPLSPIGDYYDNFTGVFDGNDHVIRNVGIDMSSAYYVGLFGYVGFDAQIHNIRIEDVVIRGSRYVGGLVGYNTGGSVINCYVSGSITGDGRYVGGLVGRNSGAISNSCAICAVSSWGSEVGGLLGENGSSSISNCYVAGSVWGKEEVGGLVGRNNGGNINSCYANASVSTSPKTSEVF